MYYNTVDDTVYVYDGASWLDLAAGGGGSGDITAVVAGNGLTGGATSGSATLDVGAGTGITVTSDAVAIDTSVVPVKTDNLSVFAASTSAAIGVGTVELGHASDTTLSRSASGVLAVEGIDVLTTTGTQSVSNKTLATDLAAGGFKVTGLGAPSSANDAATKAYVDATAEGLDVKASCVVATTADITLSGLQTIDGYTTLSGDRVLVKNQSTDSENGIYVADSSTWSRASDAAQNGELTPGTFVFVERGTVNADSGWVITTNGTITIGSTAIAWTQFSGAGQITAGSGLTKTGNTIDVAAGTGITTTGDVVAIDTSIVAQKSDKLSVFSSTTSSELAGVISDETGSGSLVFATSPSLTTPNLGTPSAVTLTNATGLPVSGITSSTTTALGVGSIELGHASDTTISRSGAGTIAVEGNNVLVSGGALGTPSSATLTNATGLPISTGVSGLGSGIATFLQTPSAQNLAAAVTETTGDYQNGNSALVFNDGPDIYYSTLWDPTLINPQWNKSIPDATLYTTDGGNLNWGVNDVNIGIFTGTANQTVTLLSGAETVKAGEWLEIYNFTTSGTFTVKSHDGTTITTIPINHVAKFTAKLSYGDTPASWIYKIAPTENIATTIGNLGQFATSTSAAIGVGSIELGHASDTTISRVSAGVIAVEGAEVLTKNIVDAKGDLLVGTANNTVTRLPVSATNGHVLTVDSAQAEGIKWAASTGGNVIYYQTTAPASGNDGDIWIDSNDDVAAVSSTAGFEIQSTLMLMGA